MLARTLAIRIDFVRRFGGALIALLLTACDVPGPAVDRTSFQMRKLDAIGQTMGVKAGPWACIHDKRTGLVWENKTDDASIRDAQWTFSWRDPSWPVGPQGTCNREEIGSCDSASFVATVNAMRLCGFDDWRLPSTNELRTLLDQRVPKPGPLVISCLFANTRRSSYWTSDQVSISGRRSGVGFNSINFANGEERALLFNRSLYLRLVRGPAYKSSQSNRGETD